MNFHGSFEEIHLLFHDTIESGEIFVAFHRLPRGMGLFERSARWRWSCSDAHPCPRCLMCREKSTVVFFCEILHLIFAVQQGQLRNLHNKLFLSCLFESAFVWPYFSLLLTIKSTISLHFPIETILSVWDGRKVRVSPFLSFPLPTIYRNRHRSFPTNCHFFELGFTLYNRSLWLHDAHLFFGFFDLHLQSCCNAPIVFIFILH